MCNRRPTVTSVLSTNKVDSVNVAVIDPAQLILSTVRGLLHITLWE